MPRSSPAAGGSPPWSGRVTSVVGDGRVVIGGRPFASGELITIDGSTGEVFAGAIAGSRVVVPEAAILLGWARELGIEVEDADAGPDGSAGTPGDEPSASAGEPASSSSSDIDDAIRILAIKGFALPTRSPSPCGRARTRPRHRSTGSSRMASSRRPSARSG